MAKRRYRVGLAATLTLMSILSGGLAEAAATGAILKVSRARISFGKSIFGVTGAISRAQAVNIRNPSRSALTLNPLAVGGANFSDFQIASDNCLATLAAGASCQVKLTFAPTALGQRAAQLMISDNAGDTVAVGLSGVGIQGKLTSRPSRLKFGSTQAGSASSSQSITLSNNDPVALEVTAVSASNGFSATQNCVGNLAADSQCTISVTFSPPAQSYAKPTPITGTLTITSDALASPQTVTLSAIAFGTAPPPPPPPFSTTQTFVTSRCNWTTSYGAGAGGDAPPITPPTGLCFPQALAVDSAGDSYVANGSDAVTIYSTGSAGTPTATIFGPNTGIHNPTGIALDGTGNLYVLNCGTCVGGDNTFDSITVFAPGSRGNVSPVTTIAGTNTTLMISISIAVDHHGNIYVGEDTNNVLVFAAGSNGNVAPSSSFQGNCDSSVCSGGAGQIALDPSDNIYIASSGYDTTASSVAVYPSGSTGLVAPMLLISGASTQLVSSRAIALDGEGNIWVSNFDAQSGTSSLASYPVGSNGDVAPSVTIAGSNTGLTHVVGLAFDGNGSLYAATSDGGSAMAGSVATFASGSTDNLAPDATIASDTGMFAPAGIALDASGKLYVTNFVESPAPTGGSVTIYSAGSNAAGAPASIITGPDTGLDAPNGIAIGMSGKIYVSNIGNNSITVYRPGSSGDQPPLATISGGNTALDDPLGIAVDRNENIYTINCSDCANAPEFDAITSYPAGSNGNVTPRANFQCLGGDTCGLNFPLAIAVDSGGKIYVSNAGSLAGVFGQTDTVTVYQPNQSGQIGGPIATIGGGNTGLAIPTGVALDANSNIYVSNAIGGQFGLGSVTVFPAASNGNVAPGAAIGGLDTLLLEPTALAVLPSAPSE